MTEQGRRQRWAATMAGESIGGLIRAHPRIARRRPPGRRLRPRRPRGREAATLAEGATRAPGAGNRVRPEEPDPCAPASSATATGSCTRSAVPAPGRQDAGVRLPRRPPAHPAHPRPRGGAGGHRRSPGPAGLNVALTEAIALGHDCGHGPGGHASEDAFTPVRRPAATTTPCGAPTSSLAPLNLCAETLDGIRNHSWSPPGAGHARGRGRVLGRPHRLRLPRLRGRRRRRASSRPIDAARRWSRDRCGDTPRPASSARSSTRRRATSVAHGSVGMAEPTGRGARRVPAVQLRAHLPAAGVARAGRRGRSGSCGRSSSTTPTAPTCCPR